MRRRRGGGAELTPLGLSLVARYRAIETAALAAARPQIEALQAELGEGATKTAAD